MVDEPELQDKTLEEEQEENAEEESQGSSLLGTPIEDFVPRAPVEEPKEEGPELETGPTFTPEQAIEDQQAQFEEGATPGIAAPGPQGEGTPDIEQAGAGLASPTRDRGVVESLLQRESLDPEDALKDLGGGPQLDPNMSGGLSEMASGEGSPWVAQGIHLGDDGKWVRVTVVDQGLGGDAFVVESTKEGGQWKSTVYDDVTVEDTGEKKGSHSYTRADGTTVVVTGHVDADGTLVVDEVTTYSAPPLVEAEPSDTSEEAAPDGPPSDPDEWAPYPGDDDGDEEPEEEDEEPVTKLKDEDDDEDDQDDDETDEKGYTPDGDESPDLRGPIGDLLGASAGSPPPKAGSAPYDPVDPGIDEGSVAGGEILPSDLDLLWDPTDTENLGVEEWSGQTGPPKAGPETLPPGVGEESGISGPPDNAPGGSGPMEDEGAMHSAGLEESAELGAEAPGAPGSPQGFGQGADLEGGGLGADPGAPDASGFGQGSEVEGPGGLEQVGGEGPGVGIAPPEGDGSPALDQGSLADAPELETAALEQEPGGLDAPPAPPAAAPEGEELPEEG